MSEKDLISSIDDESVDGGASGVPVLPLRDVVVYPHMVIPLFVGREKSIVALNKAMDAGKRILLVAQKQADHDDPQPSDLEQPAVLAPGVSAREVEDELTVGLDPGVEGDLAVAQRHRARGVGSRGVPDDVVVVGMLRRGGKREGEQGNQDRSTHATSIPPPASRAIPDSAECAKE